MNLIVDFCYFDYKCVCFSECKKNIVINGNFTKIIYSDDCISMNGLFLNLPMQVISIENGFMIFNMNHANQIIVKYLYDFECEILRRYLRQSGLHKNINMALHNQLIQGRCKLYKDNSNNHSKLSKIVLKISGIWESKTDIGLTFKFIEMTEPYI